MNQNLLTRLFVPAGAVLLLVACKPTEIPNEIGDTFNGTCVNCHRSITNIHPDGAPVSCVNCHGGDASNQPFVKAQVENLLEIEDPAFAAQDGRFIPINPTDLADQDASPFDNGPLDLNGERLGRYDPTFQVLLTAAHNLPKGCPGPEALDGSGRVHAQDLAPGQDPDGADCHAVFFWPNGMDDDGDGKVDELGEYSMLNPQDPTGLQFEFDKIDTNPRNGSIDPGEVNVGLDQAKTIEVVLPNIGNVEIPVRLGQNIDSEYGMDANYVRFMNPGDTRVAAASCGRKSPQSTFAGNCHDLEVDTTRRSIMSYMSGVLAGAIYANGAIPNSRNLTDTTGFTDRNVQDLRDGRIAYLQNYDSLDQAFNPEINRYSQVSLDGLNEQNGAITDLGDVFLRSRQNQVDLNAIFGVNFDLDNQGDDFNAGSALNTNGLEQDDCADNLGNAAGFRGNLCLESYPEALFRVDDISVAAVLAQGFTEQDANLSSTLEGTSTVEHGGDLLGNHVPGHRLIWEQKPLQDPQRSLFVLAPIPRRTLTGVNSDLLKAAEAVADVVKNRALDLNNLDIVRDLLLPAHDLTPPAPVNGVLDDRQFARLAGINPVDTALQTFRPFHSLSFPNITGDFFFFDEFALLEPANSALAQNVFILRNNPHGRGRGSGCTSCHVIYNQTGTNEEPIDPTVKKNGKQPGDVVLGKSPLINSGLGLRTGSLFNAAQQVGDFTEGGTDQAGAKIIVDEADKWAQVRALTASGAGINEADLPPLQYPTGMDDFGRERFYAPLHKITTQIPSQQCELCHAFVTRVGFAAFGRHENEGGMDFINWYTWTPRDVNGDNKVTHFIDDVTGINGNVANNGVQDGESDLGEFINNRGAAPDEDFLEFRNAVDPNQKVRIFNNLPAFTLINGTPNLVNPGNVSVSEDIDNDGLLDAGENTADLGAGEALDLPDRGSREDIIDGRQERKVYGGASGAVLLQDIHLEKKMECIDCHFFQDNHGDGNLYARNWDSVEIKCIDCHGTPSQKATLVTSGPNGGHDLRLSKDLFGIPFFLDGPNGQLLQRSRVVDGRQFVIPQVRDAITPGNPEFDADAAEAMAVLDSAGLNAHISENSTDANGIARTGFGKLNCTSCHSSWTPNCMTCHMDFDYAQTVGEIWVTQNRNPISFFQLFTIIRAPFILAFAGSNEGNKIMTQRSLMELHPNVTLNNGDALGENLTFSTARGVSGVAMNQYMSHTVRLDETRDCESCHTLSQDNLTTLQGKLGPGETPFDGILNNNILSQTLGMGSGRLGEPGDFGYAASSVGIEGIDLKAEARRATDDDGDGIFQFSAAPNHNTFQGFRGQGFGSGFLVASADDTATVKTGLNIDRSFATNLATPASDIVFLRNFIDPTELDPNNNMFVGKPRALDFAIVSAGSQLIARVVTDRKNGLVNVDLGTADLGATITALDHISPDMSDPFLYAVTDNGQIFVLDLRVALLNNAVARNLGLITGTEREGFNGTAVAASANIGGNLRDIEIDGNFAFVLEQQATSKLRLIDARKLSYFDREVNGDNNAKQVAVDFLFQVPGTLQEVGSVDLTIGNNTCAEPRKVTVFGIMAYVACGADGLFVVSVEDPLNPVVIGSAQDVADFDPQNPSTPSLVGTLSDAQGVFASDNRLFVANGQNAGAAAGVAVYDVTEPKNPRPVRLIQKPNGTTAMIDPVDISGFVEPGQLWLLVSDSGGGQVGRAHAINVTEAYNIRVRLGEHAAAAKGVLAGQNAEANGSVPGFRPEENLTPFASQGLDQPRAFFEDTNIRFTLDLRDALTPNDPANIDEILAGQEHIVSFLLAGDGDIRLAQFQDLDRMVDFSGFPLRDGWSSAVNINTGCATNLDGTFTATNCASEDVNEFGQLATRPLTGPSFNNGNISRGVMDLMRGVFVREVDGLDADGNGMGNLVCTGVASRNAQGSITAINACSYPPDVAAELGL